MKKKGGADYPTDSSSNLRCDHLCTFFKKVLNSVFKPCFKQYQSARATSKNGYSLMLLKRARNVILDGLSGNYFSPLLEIFNRRAMKKL